ncbi:MAG: hypothetical protein M1813_008105 [Trichoglossum hirsutum]|nr:MAG: hypothetical protein M1813_008105 [Trichoglossum hirsutum]
MGLSNQHQHKHSRHDKEGRKRKREDGGSGQDTSKPTAVFKPKGGREWTLSVAVPGSIVANAQTHELKTILAGQIARALAVFCVDEVVVFDDRPAGQRTQTATRHAQYTGTCSPGHFLAHVLSYLETPPYLRRQLFPLHANLRFAGQLPSLDMPHHVREGEWSEFREGVVVGGEEKGEGKKGKEEEEEEEEEEGEEHEEGGDPMKDAVVDAGLNRKILIRTQSSIPPNTRITLHLPPSSPPHSHTPIRAEPTHPSAPRTSTGYYWGYTTRLAGSLSDVFTECPHATGYTLSVGTSERGRPLPYYTATHSERRPQHVLVAFGGLAGLEAAVGGDEELARLGVAAEDAESVFDWWIDVCPGQGSRTIRTEEAIWLALGGLRGWLVGDDGTEA